MVATDAGRRRDAPPPVAWPWVLVSAGVLLAVLVAFSARYGPHRDELYFLAAGRHLAWGYPDQPVLTPLIAHLADVVAPGSLVALHLPPAIAMTVVVVLAALMARELGGGTGAQVLTMVATGTGVVTVFAGHILSTATIDVFFWVAISYTVLWILQRDRPHGWLAVGVLSGVALEDKHLVAFLLAGIVVGVALTPAVRHHLRSPWAWGGVAIALVLWVPNLAWQALHGWPQLALAADIHDEYGVLAERLNFVALLLIQFSPATAAVWVYGLVRLFRVPTLVRARPLAWAFAFLVVLFFLTGGKAYYLVGAVPLLVAAGACGLAERSSPRWLFAAGAVLALSGMVVWPAGLPILSARALGQSFFADINEDQAEMMGWPAFVATVQSAVSSSGATLAVAENYGEAGALQWYGLDVPVYSGHNGFAAWGPPTGSAGPFVLVGYDSAPAWAVGCRVVAHVDDGVGVDNEEQGGAVQVCAAPAGTWASVWPQVVHLSA